MDNRFVNRFDGAFPRDLSQDALGAVMGYELQGVLPVDGQAPPDGILPVVVALDEERAANVADAGHARLLFRNVVRREATDLGTTPAPAQAAHDFLVVDRQEADGTQVQE